MPEPRESPLILKALRAVPHFRGKYRLARLLSSEASRSRETLLQDRYGNQLVVPNLLEQIGFSLAVDGSYEPTTVDLLRSHATPDSTFVDVGANIGAYTLALADRAARVIAIEASPLVLPYLRKNIALSGRTNVALFEGAVSKPGVDAVPFYLPPMDHFGMGSTAPQFGAEPVSISANTLDQVLASHHAGKVSAVKVDVEGYEAHVFLGAEELLRSRPAPLIVFEFLDWAEERAFPGRRGWAQEILADFGYTLWSLEDYPQPGRALAKPVVEGGYTIVAIAPQ
jgi:FkbM family methyltransferase